MANKNLDKIIGSLSRALGNDLVSYNSAEEGVCTIKLWPPISQDNKRYIESFIKTQLPGARVTTNSKKGVVTIKGKLLVSSFP